MRSGVLTECRLQPPPTSHDPHCHHRHVPSVFTSALHAADCCAAGCSDSLCALWARSLSLIRVRGLVSSIGLACGYFSVSSIFVVAIDAMRGEARRDEMRLGMPVTPTPTSAPAPWPRLTCLCMAPCKSCSICFPVPSYPHTRIRIGGWACCRHFCCLINGARCMAHDAGRTLLYVKVVTQFLSVSH